MVSTEGATSVNSVAALEDWVTAAKMNDVDIASVVDLSAVP
jgi:hypothetical protein